MVLQSLLRKQTLKGQNLRIQVLVSAVNQDVQILAEKMNIETDAVIVNQCDRNGYQKFVLQQNADKQANVNADMDTGNNAGCGQCVFRGFYMTERGL